jgi:hypothetical protein
MQVLRVGGEYSVARRRQAVTTLLRIGVLGSAGVAAVSLAVHPAAAAALGVAMASVANRARQRLRRLNKGMHGEGLVAELLRSLPDDYFLLNDLVLPGHGGNIDHVVIGPCGVVVIETKNFSGTVESHGNAWFVAGRPHRSISKQVNCGAIAVRETLSRAHPDLADSVLRFVDSVVVFTNPTRRVHVDRAQTTVARYSQLLDVILAKARRKKVPAAIAGRLAATLANSGPAGSTERAAALNQR